MTPIDVGSDTNGAAAVGADTVGAGAPGRTTTLEIPVVRAGDGPIGDGPVGDGPVGDDAHPPQPNGSAAKISVAVLCVLMLVPTVIGIGLKLRQTPGQSDRGAATERVNSVPIGSTPAGTADGCTIAERLGDGDRGDPVYCLETKLAEQGYLDGPADDAFDAATAAAVEKFQEANGLVVDGVVGPETGHALGTWAGPDKLAPEPETCPRVGHAAVIDRFNQRTWLCDGGKITKVMPMTSAAGQPDPGSYAVFEKDLHSSSDLTGRHSTMTHFVAFTTGKFTGARVAFHSVPKYDDGSFVQPLSSVGSPELYGESSGCIRVLPDDAQLIWNWLDVGDAVIVVS